jgi:hypothetical protein
LPEERNRPASENGCSELVILQLGRDSERYACHI